MGESLCRSGFGMHLWQTPAKKMSRASTRPESFSDQTFLLQTRLANCRHESRSATRKPVRSLKSTETVTMHASIRAARISGPTPEPDGGAAVEFRFGAADPMFAGHFPKQPLVPGVFQLEMARMGAEWSLGEQLTVR